MPRETSHLALVRVENPPSRPRLFRVSQKFAISAEFKQFNKSPERTITAIRICVHIMCDKIMYG